MVLLIDSSFGFCDSFQVYGVLFVVNKKYTYFAFALYFCSIMQLNADDAQINDAAYQAHLHPYSSNVLQDLEVFPVSGKDGSGALFAAIDRTSTAVGQAALKYRVTNPKTTVSDLRRAQVLPKVLLADAQALTFLDDALQGIKGGTAALEALQEKDAYTQKAFDEQYMANRLYLPASVRKSWKESPRLMQAEVYHKKYFSYLVMALSLLRITNDLVGNARSYNDSSTVVVDEANMRLEAEWNGMKDNYRECEPFGRAALLKDIVENQSKAAVIILSVMEFYKHIAQLSAGSIILIL